MRFIVNILNEKDQILRSDASSTRLPFGDPESGVEVVRNGIQFQLCGVAGADAWINGQKAEGGKAELAHGDIIESGGTRARFLVEMDPALRSWRAGMVSQLAVAMLSAMVIFEVAVIVWLPYRLYSMKIWEKHASLESVVKLQDELRTMVNGMKTKGKYEKAVRSALAARLDETAFYLKANREFVDRDQIRALQEDLTAIERIARAWDKRKSDYTAELSLEAGAWVERLAGSLENRGAQ